MAAQTQLNPPFGLHWGDSPEKLITWATRQSLNVTITVSGSQPELRLLKIQPDKGFLSGTQANALEGRFIKGKLHELTVHYVDVLASNDEVADRFETLKKQITLEYGSLLKNKQQRVVVNQFVTYNLAFHKETARGLFILLAFTEEEDLLRNLKQSRFSIIYRSDYYKNESLVR